MISPLYSHSARVVSVFDTTGSSVVNAPVLAYGTFTPKALARDPNSEKALRLEKLGTEVVQGDLWDVSRTL